MFVFGPKGARTSVKVVKHNPGVQRWLDFLATYRYTLEYHKGTANGSADLLSRIPVTLPASEDDRCGLSRLTSFDEERIYLTHSGGLSLDGPPTLGLSLGGLAPSSQSIGLDGLGFGRPPLPQADFRDFCKDGQRLRSADLDTPHGEFIPRAPTSLFPWGSSWTLTSSLNSACDLAASVFSRVRCTPHGFRRRRSENNSPPRPLRPLLRRLLPASFTILFPRVRPASSPECRHHGALEINSSALASQRGSIGVGTNNSPPPTEPSPTILLPRLCPRLCHSCPRLLSLRRPSLVPSERISREELSGPKLLPSDPPSSQSIRASDPPGPVPPPSANPAAVARSPSRPPVPSPSGRPARPPYLAPAGTIPSAATTTEPALALLGARSSDATPPTALPEVPSPSELEFREHVERYACVDWACEQRHRTSR